MKTNWLELLQWFNNNPGLSAIIALIALIAGFLGYKKVKSTNKPFIKAGRDIMAGGDVIVGNKTINNHLSHNKDSENLDHFLYKINNSKWRKESFDHHETWICEDNNLYQIKRGDREGEFTEKWTQVYPAKFGSGLYHVALEIKGIKIKEVSFVYMDDGRIEVPLTQQDFSKDVTVYYWIRDSLEFSLGKLIGDFYIYKNMDGVAKRSGIEIR